MAGGSGNNDEPIHPIYLEGQADLGDNAELKEEVQEVIGWRVKSFPVFGLEF